MKTIKKPHRQVTINYVQSPKVNYETENGTYSMLIEDFTKKISFN